MTDKQPIQPIQPIIALPCRCAHGHTFTRSEAEEKDFECDIDGTKIVCLVGHDAGPGAEGD